MIKKIILGLAAVDDQGQATLSSCGDLQTEALFLRCARTEIVVVVEADLADGMTVEAAAKAAGVTVTVPFTPGRTDAAITTP